MRPRRLSLFFQIFIWFWAAMATLVITLAALEIGTRQEPLALASRSLAERSLRSEAEQANQIWRTQGKSALAAELAKFQAQTQVEAFLIDPSTGQDVLGRPIPRTLRRVINGASQDVSWSVSGLSVQTSVTAGSHAIFVARFERGPFAGSRLGRGVRLAAIVIVAGVVCWILAARFARPIHVMRETARNLTDGDLSARVQLEKSGGGDEITQLAQDFNAMADHIETLVTAQQRLVGDVSHELRSPLTRLKIALALAFRDAPPTPNLQEHLSRIEQEAGSLEQLINELLQLSRLENQLSPEAIQEFDWAAAVAAVTADVKWECQNDPQGAEITSRSAVDSAPVRGDAVLLKRALENVLRNAARYAPPDSTVTISLTQEDGNWVTSVRDTGPGVPEAELQAIFRPFYRVDTARERDSQTGTGLGLAIASRAIHLHGGSIEAKNLAPQGFEVQIKLPAS